MKHIYITLLALLSSVMAFADAPLRRPISVEQPAWFVHIDNWNNADPQKIIDLIPEDIKPYVVFNVSMSISHDETTGEFNRVPNGYSTARTWLRVCAENNVWAMVQPSSGGFSHFPEDDLRVYEEFYREYPNFLGWNYCEQFWGFDDKFSCSFDERLAHFADLMRLARKYGGYTCISFCGNIWSLPLNPLAMMKRNADFAAQAKAAPQNLIICDKYTMSSMFYEYESTSFGTFVAGYTHNFGIRFDQCGWSGELESEKENMPFAAGAAPVLNNWLLNGGTVNDGPELIWNQCFKDAGTRSLSDGYTRRVFQTFSQFDNISIDLYRKILDGTIRIPSRDEVLERQKLVIINDVNTGSNEEVYGADITLYDGLYNMKDGQYHHEQTNWFKKTGRYPTIPIVAELVDDKAKAIPTQVRRSQYKSRWNTIAKKQTEFNNLFPEEYTGNAFAGRVQNRWLIYNPLKNGKTATANIPMQFNTCESISLTMSQYTTALMSENADSLHLYLTNYRTDVANLKNDTIVIKGASSQPSMTWADRAKHTTSRIIKEDWTDGIYTLVVSHNGPLDVNIKCSGTATDRKPAVANRQLTIPEKPAIYEGGITHQCEDFDYKNTGGYNLAPYALNTVKGFHGIGYHNFGTNTTAAIRDSFKVQKAGKYNVIVRYSAQSGEGRLALYVNGKRASNFALPATGKGEWKEHTVKGVELAAGKNQLRLASYSNKNTLYLDEVTVVHEDYSEARSLNVDRFGLTLDTYSNETKTDSVYLNARSLEGALTIETEGEYGVSTSIDGDFSSSLEIATDENGNIVDRVVYVRVNAISTFGTYKGTVTFSADGCLDHTLTLTSTIKPHPVTLVYDFTDDRATGFAATPPAKEVTIPTYGKATAGVTTYQGGNVLKIYGVGGARNGSGALDLGKFTSLATDYSVTWKQYNSSTGDHKVGVTLRAGKVVGTSSAGYAEGFREGYVFIAYNRSSGGSEYRIYKSTSANSLEMMVNQGSDITPTVGKPTWYRATVSGHPHVTMTFEYSTDGVNWTMGASTSDSKGTFKQGSTQLAWGLAAAQNNFYYDDITFEGVTYDEAAGIHDITTDWNETKNHIYNLQGQRVMEMKKGQIYIINGKKVVNK